VASEFDIIRRYFTRPAPRAEVGVGDDCALVKVASGVELAISADMLVCGQHFFADADPLKLGHKALAVNLSDMAAMGAVPRWAMLCLALPEPDEAWLEGFSRGFFALTQEYGLDLIGGDTTRGPLNICVQILGEVPEGQALRRDRAKPGDEVWVSGTLGDAGLALAHAHGRIELSPEDAAACFAQLDMPQPRVALGLALRSIATSAIDISDGLVADLGHILESSGVSADVEFSALPVSAAGARHLPGEIAQQAVLAGGDDYELCFTAPAALATEVATLARRLRMPLTRIGRIAAGSGLRIYDAGGNPLSIGVGGFDHFR
jgi:thiamine-monophosphate kinase